jgi:ABC-type phosphate transport system auxiliary subunit
LNYLTALGKISGTTKNELIAEFIALKNEINSKVTTDMLALSALKDKIQYQYPTVTDAENTQLSADLKKISDNYALAGTTFTTSLNNLEAKYKSNLNTYKSNLKSSLDTNKTQVDALRNFQNTYDALYSGKTGFEQNFVGFKDSYLSFA